MAFVVVQFLETDEVAIISQSWLVDENTCKWPAYENKMLIKRALLEKRAPENNWKDHEIFIFGVHKTYAGAKKEVDLALHSGSDDDDKTSEKKREKVQSILNNSASFMPIVVVKSEHSDCSSNAETIFVPHQSVKSLSTSLQCNSITESQNNSNTTAVSDSDTRVSSDNSLNEVQIQCTSTSSLAGVRTEDTTAPLQSLRNSSSKNKSDSSLSKDNCLTAELVLDASNLNTEASDVENKKSRKRKQRKNSQEWNKESDNEEEEDDDNGTIKRSKRITTASEPPFVLLEDIMAAKHQRETVVSLSQNPSQPEICQSLPSPLSEDGASASQSSDELLRLFDVNESYKSSESSNSVEKVFEMHQPAEAYRLIIKMLDQICNVQREHTLLLRKLLPVEKIDSCRLPSSMPELPLKSHSDLEEFELFLRNASNFSSSVKYFGYRTSADVNGSTRRLMSEIISDDLAQNFNWAGRPPKKPFKMLKTRFLILYALKENPFTKDVPVDTVECIIKDWLKHASFRIFSRIKKRDL